MISEGTTENRINPDRVHSDGGGITAQYDSDPAILADGADLDDRAFHQELRKRNLRMFLITAVVFNSLYVSWALFDYVLVPDHWRFFLGLRLIAVTLTTLVVLIVMRPGQAELSAGHLAALIAAICGATASVIVRKIGSEERSVVLLMFPIVGNFIAMGAALPFAYQPMPIEHLGLMGVISLFGLAGSFLVILAYRAGEAVIVAPMQYSQILWATAYGYFLFSERPDGGTILGASVIIASGLYIVFRESRVGASEHRPVIETRGRNETVTTPRSSVLQRVLRARIRASR